MAVYPNAQVKQLVELEQVPQGKEQGVQVVPVKYDPAKHPTHKLVLVGLHLPQFLAHAVQAPLVRTEPRGQF